LIKQFWAKIKARCAKRQAEAAKKSTLGKAPSRPTRERKHDTKVIVRDEADLATVMPFGPLGPMDVTSIRQAAFVRGIDDED
jgi:hypothetical protein